MGDAGHPYWIPLVVQNGADNVAAPVHTVGPAVSTFYMNYIMRVCWMPICVSTFYIAPLSTESYALSMSIAHRYSCYYAPLHFSTADTMVVIAVLVDLPGQKPCCSEENMLGI